MTAETYRCIDIDRFPNERPTCGSIANYHAPECRAANAPPLAPPASAQRRARIRQHTRRVPAVRYEVHRNGKHPSIWVAHDNRGTCERRGDEHCFGSRGAHITGGPTAQAYLIDEAVKEVRREWAAFVAEMQARGKVFA